MNEFQQTISIVTFQTLTAPLSQGSIERNYAIDKNFIAAGFTTDPPTRLVA